MDRRGDGGEPRSRVIVQAAVSAQRTLGLLIRRRLHLRRARLGLDVSLPDGRRYTVFRESTCVGSADNEAMDDEVMLAVWFHLKGIPADARIRRWIFEYLCIVNTLLFAGFNGYRVKLWMVDRESSDFAGLYAWNGLDDAERYAKYITTILRPLSRPRTVGYETHADCRLDAYLAAAEKRAGREVEAA